MRAIGRQPQRAPDGAPIHYERDRLEQTTLYRLVQRHAASFIAHTEADTGTELPRFIKDEFDAFLECCILAHGFLRLRVAPDQSHIFIRTPVGSKFNWRRHTGPSGPRLPCQLDASVVPVGQKMLTVRRAWTPCFRRAFGCTIGASRSVYLRSSSPAALADCTRLQASQLPENSA